MKWTQIQVCCSQIDLDTVCAVMSMIDTGLMIEDYSDIDENLTKDYGEFVDEKILQSDRSICKVSLYIPEEKSLSDSIDFLKNRFSALSLDVNIELVGMDEEDWANEWKKDYKTLHIGNRTVINPPWITYEPKKLLSKWIREWRLERVLMKQHVFVYFFSNATYKTEREYWIWGPAQVF